MAIVRQSKKRDAMLAFLRTTTRHPSADQVYRRLKPEYPDLSLATVYRNLGQLCEQGLIKRVGTVDGQERYDGEVRPHSHFICNRCGSILDLPWVSPGEDWAGQLSVQYGFRAESLESIVRGLCKDCKDFNIGGKKS
ncbi:MAG: transcriptional repressor [Oscillospiraceae bacterium]